MPRTTGVLPTVEQLIAGLIKSVNITLAEDNLATNASSRLSQWSVGEHLFTSNFSLLLRLLSLHYRAWHWQCARFYSTLLATFKTLHVWWLSSTDNWCQVYALEGLSWLRLCQYWVCTGGNQHTGYHCGNRAIVWLNTAWYHEKHACQHLLFGSSSKFLKTVLHTTMAVPIGGFKKWQQKTTSTVVWLLCVQ